MAGLRETERSGNKIYEEVRQKLGHDSTTLSPSHAPLMLQTPTAGGVSDCEGVYLRGREGGREGGRQCSY